MKKSCHGIWILCGRKPRGGLLAHIIDSRVAARDAPALLCPVERWQEAWFRDNSFLIACLIHTTSNYTAVPRASLLLSRSLLSLSLQIISREETLPSRPPSSLPARLPPYPSPCPLSPSSLSLSVSPLLAGQSLILCFNPFPILTSSSSLCQARFVSLRVVFAVKEGRKKCVPVQFTYASSVQLSPSHCLPLYILLLLPSPPSSSIPRACLEIESEQKRTRSNKYGREGGGEGAEITACNV